MTGHKTEPLGSLCDVLDSKRRPITKKDRTSGAYPYYGATGVLDYVDGYIFDETLVLIGEDGAKWGAGERTAFTVDGKCWVNNHAHVVRPYRKLVIDKWIVYYLNSSDLSPYITGLTVPKLNQAKLREIPIPLPPLFAQKRIVAILDDAFERIDTAIANAKRSLDKARDLFDSYLNTVLAEGGERWTGKKLGDIASFKNGLNYTKDSKGETIKIVGVNDFQKNFYIPFNQLESAKIEGKLSVDYHLHAGDILTVRSNGNKQLIGRCILAKSVLDTTSHSGFTIRIRAKSTEVCPEYLTHFLKSKASREALIESGDGANISSLNQQVLASLPIKLPPLSEQSDIANSLQAMELQTKSLEAVYLQKLKCLAALKQAILQKAFFGELIICSTKAVNEAAE